MDWRLYGEFALAMLTRRGTWIALGTIITGAGFQIAPEHWQLISLIGMAGGGALEFLIAEFKAFKLLRATRGAQRPASEAPPQPPT